MRSTRAPGHLLRRRVLHGIEGIEDSAVASYSFASGLHATLTSVWHDLLDRPSNRQVEVFGSTLSAQSNGEWAGNVSWSRNGPVETRSGADVAITSSSTPRTDRQPTAANSSPSEPALD